MNFESISDEELKEILKNKDQYTRKALLEAVSETKKRGIAVPEEFNTKDYVNNEDNTWITGNDWWIWGLRVISLVVFVVIISASFFYGMPIIKDGETILGIEIIVGGIIASFITVAATMVFLNIAQDIAILREMKQREYYRK